ncbi:MAG: hypothetical protein R3B09_00875 [Nannocystaceae bacterium]
MNTNTQSPSLYAARHEDSALFSAEEVLRATAEAAARGRSGSSGFIDVRDLQAPSLGLAGLQREAPRPAAPRRPSASRGLHGVALGLALALVGSLTTVAAPTPAHARHGRDHQGDASHLRHYDADDFDGDVLIIPDAVEVEPEAAPEPEAAAPEVESTPVKASARPSTRSRSTQKAAPAAKAEPVKAEPVKAEPAAKAGPDPMSVECLLDPGACKQPKAAPAPAPKPSAGPSLPEKLDAAALKVGVSSARDAARSQCARLADGADKVEVKLSIEGSSGSVLSARAQGEAAGSAAATCVEDALKGARFDRFKAPQQGLLVTVRF